MMKTQQREGLQDALSQAMASAIAGDEAGATGVAKNGSESQRRQKPGKSGYALPVGRPKGVPNKVTRTIRDAVEAASQPGACHEEGLAGWLIERARGSLGDRQIFAAMVNKAMPLQVQANVDGGIKLELSWLGSRSIGTTAAQIPEQRTQVLDLQQESDGSYRIKDPHSTPEGGAAGGGSAPGAAGDAQGGGK